MKVILQQDVKGQGKKGQMVDVSDGYARNYLLPRKLAVPATADNLNAMKLQEKVRQQQLERERQQAHETAERLKGCVVKIPAKAGTGGRLFGAVTTKEISEALAAQCGIDVAKQKILQDDPIKQCGTYELKCRLGFEVTGTVYVVVSEEK
ncbi:50S ribosomal protein L9 [Papillibacter cinnamivorans]|mgnify:CR=1 FL=1|uniref:Large ribosomal subunit protein bL9 n=1 Tax=Papillibacter cinnamivorans DSM 12816 TaxID=1122930 RepID=A0A1W2CZD4_9FIRM|nr:50S ribosomal protein L9 [Papillibacter cinnamivorans]SMC90627.1 large subunit ribosomal protein L9 [Papillibacter cinnamivorans DSM 12816]